MRYRNAACMLYVCFMAVPGWAQPPAQAPAPSPESVPPPAWAFNDIACAPGLAVPKKERASLPTLRVIGSQDTANRDMLGPGDTLVVSGGSNAGVQPGQRYFVRRLVNTYGGPKPLPATIHTAGWIQILGVDTALATATIVHACGDGMLLDDYLDPFTPPMIAARSLPGTTPQYENMGHIMTGVEGLYTGGRGQLMNIDRGSNAGVALGQRFLVFRDKRELIIQTTGRSKIFGAMDGQLPLVEIGEVLVVSVRADDASVQILGSKDAITAGDLIAPIR